jgi:hypothetical protein
MTTPEPLSDCCKAPYLWLTCEGCDDSDERHDFAACSECGGDI